MNQPEGRLYSKIHQLVVRQLEGTATQAEQAELQGMLDKSPDGRRTYLEYMQETANLRWLCDHRPQDGWAVVAKDPTGSISSGHARRSISTVSLATLFTVAASLLMMTAVYQIQRATDGSPRVGHGATDGQSTGSQSTEHHATDAGDAAQPERVDVATVTRLQGATWDEGSRAWRLLSRLPVGQSFKIAEGIVELTFDVGAQITVFAPAELEIISPTSVRCTRGRATTLVGKHAKGFTIETPQTRIVDLGTQFGVQIYELGETEVVVFEGSVDLMYGLRELAGSTSSLHRRRLSKGDGLFFDKAGTVSRLVSIHRDSFLATSGPREDRHVIERVYDNMREGENVKCYQIASGGLEEDAPSFVDRNHQWNGIDESGMPAFLIGADYVMPFNNDKFIGSLEVTVHLSRPATLCVFFDNNMPVPEWLQRDFVDTGLDIGLDGAKTIYKVNHTVGTGPGSSIDFPFSIWKRDLDRPGPVTLGGVIDPGREQRRYGFNMYGIAAVARD